MCNGMENFPPHVKSGIAVIISSCAVVKLCEIPAEKRFTHLAENTIISAISHQPSYVIVNLGCGSSPVNGAVNIDNSPSVFLGHHRVLCACLNVLGLLSPEQRHMISSVREHGIIRGDARKIPMSDDSVDVLYTSHMAEHLYEEEFRQFLAEAERVLKPGGILRISVPDVEVAVKSYLHNGDADVFCDRLMLCHRQKLSGIRRLNAILFGDRGLHKWLYDSRSMKKYIETHTRVSVTLLSAGGTTISFPTSIDYREREEESLSLECMKSKPLS